MKRIKSIFALTLALLLILSLAACSGNTKTAETTAANTNEKSAVQETDKQAAGSGTGETTSGTSKVLVAYFSATGTTKGVAEKIASLENADLYEIVPAQPYSDDDLNWHDSNSRTTKEQNDKAVRPEIGSDAVSLDGYSTVFIGYPIWWGEEPRIMDTFVESYDFSDKTIIPFCTSASSPLGTSASNLHALAPDAVWKDGRRFAAGTSRETIEAWLQETV